MECISCKTKTSQGVEFPCPKCKTKLYRCRKCRNLSIEYKCPTCQYEGP